MLWIRHFTNARRDPFLQELFRVFGPEGLVAWWNTIEYVAEQVTPKNPWPIVDTTAEVFSETVQVPAKSLKKIYSYLNKAKKLRFKQRKNRWVVYWPKILKASDEYTRKQLSKHPDIDRILSGEYPERLRSLSTRAEQSREEQRRGDESSKSSDPKPKTRRARKVEAPDPAIVDRVCFRDSFTLLASALADATGEEFPDALVRSWAEGYPLRRIFNVCQRAFKAKNRIGFIRKALESNMDIPDRMNGAAAQEFAQRIHDRNKSERDKLDKEVARRKKLTERPPKKDGETDDQYLRRIAGEARDRVLKSNS